MSVVLRRGSTCPLSREMGGCIPRRGTTSSCQSPATSKIVKRCCSPVFSCKQRNIKYPDLYQRPAMGYLRTPRLKGVLGRVRDGVAPLPKRVRGVTPENFVKICFQNPAFWRHERQKSWPLLVWKIVLVLWNTENWCCIYSVSQTPLRLSKFFIFFRNGYEFSIDFYTPIIRSYVR